VTDLTDFAHRLAEEPLWQWAAAAAASVLLHAWIFFGGTYGAHHWALKPGRHKALKGAAYVAALPVRILFALFSGVVATLIWALVLGGVWLLWKTLHS
jgi:hypothetical protein